MKNAAKDLCKTHPGASDRRKEFILALCRGCDTSGVMDSAENIGKYIVRVANKIIEETEQ